MITLPTGRTIGPEQHPYIIGEVGSNWQTEAHCMDSITQAKKAGADAVKFQLYSRKELYGHALTFKRGGSSPPGLTLTDDLPGTLKQEWLPRLAQKARDVGIDFLCTAFSPEGYDLVNPHVHMHKIASSEASDVSILQKVRELGKPVLLSTGAQHFEEIEYSLKRLGEVPVVLLHCVAAYPAREARLGRILALRDTLNRPVGYSDHTTSVDAIPHAAIEAGACVIEKHVTQFPDLDTPDRPHSITMDEFKRMVEFIRTGATPDANQVSREEKDMILRHKRRLKATRQIHAGDKLEYGKNFGIFRSLQDDAHAYPPKRGFDDGDKPGAHGKAAKRAIAAGDGIGPGDF